jgi:hypothetical protein
MDPTAEHALVQARHQINTARMAAACGDTRQQNEYAQSAIDSATTILCDPAATEREVVAAHFVLCEALALEGHGDTCGTELIDVEREAAALDGADRLWLQNYLRPDRHDITPARPPRSSASRAQRMERSILRRKRLPVNRHADR